MTSGLTPNKLLQRTFDPPPIFAAAKKVVASNAAELRRYNLNNGLIMKNKTILLHSAILLSLIISFNSYAEKKELAYPNAVNKLYVDSSKNSEYALLAKSAGFEINKQYTYREYSDICHKNKLGIAGTYDFLLLSTGGNEWDYEALKRMNKEKCGWEMTYYSNHNLTVIHEVCNDDSRTHTYVRILKIGKGKNTNLHLE